MIARDIVAREPLEFLVDADAPAPDPVRVVEQFVERLARDGTGRVELAPRFLDNDAEFAAEFVGVKERIPHLVRLQRDQLARRARRGRDVVDRAIVRGVRVERAAERLGALREFTGAERGRALEEHVLEHVRDADRRVRFVEESGAHVRDD